MLFRAENISSNDFDANWSRGFKTELFCSVSVENVILLFNGSKPIVMVVRNVVAYVKFERYRKK